jgi:threonine dehydratase
MTTFSVSISDIRTAAQRIRPHIIRTPCVSSATLSESIGVELWLKCENLQFVGAFKARGACNAVLSLTDDEAARGVVTHSSGNHAAALARAAAIRGIAAHIVMPDNSAAVKLNAVRALGVEPILCQPTAEARSAKAQQVMQRTGAVMIHPYDDARIVAGQGTVGLEIADQTPRPDIVVVPVGGGGLLAGCLIALKSILPGITVIAAEPELADDARRSVDADAIQQPTRYDTIADGLRTPLGELTFPIIRSLVDDILLVNEESIIEATRRLLLEGKLLSEPSGAVSTACVIQHNGRFAGKRVAAVISGGNLDLDQLSFGTAGGR